MENKNTESINRANYIIGYIFGMIMEQNCDTISDSDIDNATRNPGKWLAVAINKANANHIKLDEEFLANILSMISPSDLEKLNNVPISDQIFFLHGRSFGATSKHFNKIGLLRRSLGMTQHQLADKSGIPLRTICAYEMGYRKLNNAKAETVNSLAKALKCKPEILIK